MKRDFSVLSIYEQPPPRSSNVSGGWGAYRRSQAECDEHRSEREDGIEFKSPRQHPALSDGPVCRLLRQDSLIIMLTQSLFRVKYFYNTFPRSSAGRASGCARHPKDAEQRMFGGDLWQSLIHARTKTAANI